MKKSLLLISLLGLSALAPAAELLYQWKEADGSLTFSPVPPPEGSGLEYKIVNASNPEPSPVLLSAIESPVMADRSNGTASIQRAAPAIANNPATTPAVKLNYAPTTPGQQLEQGITRSAENNPDESNGTANDASEILPTGDAGTSSNHLTARANDEKNRHCSGLRKRIVSLEQVMSSSNDAETMDNAVTQITVYQHSFNQYCTENDRTSY